MWILGALGQLPRAGTSTRGEGYERRYFYGTVWAVAVAQPVLWLLWKAAAADARDRVLKLVGLPRHPRGVGNLAFLGRLPRTRPIIVIRYR